MSGTVVKLYGHRRSMRGETLPLPMCFFVSHKGHGMMLDD